MINAFTALLAARNPALGRFRSYRLEAGPDLFGAWLVQITYGRIGTRGRSTRYSAPDEAQARKLVRRSLRRRATAKERIGVSYCFRELVDPWNWLTMTVNHAALPAAYDDTAVTSTASL
jgi:predicted DNA-binding WGR domain protein